MGYIVYKVPIFSSSNEELNGKFKNENLIKWNWSVSFAYLQKVLVPHQLAFVKCC